MGNSKQGRAMSSSGLTSLLDVILASRKGDISVLNRVIYVGTTTAKETSDLEGYHRELAARAGFMDDKMRGLLLHFTNDTVMHLLEGPAPEMNSFMNFLREDQGKPFEHESLRVILTTEDIDGYGFPMWVCKQINLPRPDGDMDKKDPIAPQIYRTFMDLLEIGKLLNAMQPGELEESLDNLRSNYHEKLPGNELVGSMIKSVHTMPLDSYHEIYSEEVQVVEESELCWPQAPPLQY